MPKLNGPAIGTMAAGVVFVYAGAKGYSVLKAIQNIVQGKKAGEGQTIGSISSSASSVSASPIPGTAISGTNQQNLVTVARYLVANGYSRAAAAGIAACIAGESGGDPESVGSGGNGLIGWTPARPDLVTGDPNRDLNAQMVAIIQYNNGIGQPYIKTLNAITDPVAAADYYSQFFEKPLVLYSDVMAGAAQYVYGRL